MKGYIEERAMEIARYIIDNNATVRQAAKKYGISKSTVHKDITERLRQISPVLPKRQEWFWMLTNRSVTFVGEWQRERNISINIILSDLR